MKFGDKNNIKQNCSKLFFVELKYILNMFVAFFSRYIFIIVSFLVFLYLIFHGLSHLNLRLYNK